MDHPTLPFFTPASCIVVCTYQLWGRYFAVIQHSAWKWYTKSLDNPEKGGVSAVLAMRTSRAYTSVWTSKKSWLGGLPTALLTKAAVRQQVGAGWLSWTLMEVDVRFTAVSDYSLQYSDWHHKDHQPRKDRRPFSRQLWVFQLPYS